MAKCIKRESNEELISHLNSSRADINYDSVRRTAFPERIREVRYTIGGTLFLTPLRRFLFVKLKLCFHAKTEFYTPAWVNDK